jgi:hypothetical protein
MEFKGLDWINVTQNRIYCCGLHRVMNLDVRYIEMHFIDLSKQDMEQERI